jgi:hypothetical protein
MHSICHLRPVIFAIAITAASAANSQGEVSRALPIPDRNCQLGKPECSYARNPQGASAGLPGIYQFCNALPRPEIPAAALRQGISGTVVAIVRVEGGSVSEILGLSGPSVFHKSVASAMAKYRCSESEKPVVATQSFSFAVGQQ